ncbi:ETC complex I subunit [Breoghania sp.]|uniref:ETC complex I subunit n=1 Tax=Breoghania sp. TaxID=2065378 RepID=UPI002AA6348C|nr:ETC complex I subunit [Breoghania sp.]
MVARIYRPAKSAMQSGRGKTKRWVLDYEPDSPRMIEPLMGYNSSQDMNGQVRVHFETREAAVAYAKARGIAYRIIEPKERKTNTMAYADNFRFDRQIPWTH